MTRSSAEQMRQIMRANTMRQARSCVRRCNETAASIEAAIASLKAITGETDDPRRVVSPYLRLVVDNG